MPTAQTLTLEDTLTNNFGWEAFREERPNYGSERSRRIGFLRWVARKTRVDFDVVKLCITFCVSCGKPEGTERAHEVRNGWVCATCCEDYAACHNCAELVPDGERIRTIQTQLICRICATRDFRYCQTCVGHYHRLYRADHRHGTRTCCESPTHVFTVPSIGNSPLQNDTRLRVSLPSGELSEEGVDAIRGQIMNQAYYDDAGNKYQEWRDLAWAIEQLGTKWQTKEGNYTKRLSRFAHKKYGLKVPPQLITMVGNVARDHSSGDDYSVEVTRELNRSATSFGYRNSCWWSSYSRSRCALKTNGGFAIRSFNGAGDVSGRAWVMPLKKNTRGGLEPTFDTMTPDAYVVFNGYGKMTGYTAPRILCQMTGMTYRKIQFTCNPMYVNSSAGYLVAAEDLASRFTDNNVLSLRLAHHSDLFMREGREKELVNA